MSEPASGLQVFVTFFFLVVSVIIFSVVLALKINHLEGVVCQNATTPAAIATCAKDGYGK